jgi:hypothetical protein
VRARVLVSVAVAAAVALGTAGCEFMTPQSTTEHYDASDGVSITVGKVDVRNAILITKNNRSARFVATLVNNTNDPQTVTIELGDSAADMQTVVVAADQHLDLASPKNTSVVFEKANAKAGSLRKMFFTYPGAEGGSVRVPVLTGAMEEYSSLVPTPTPSATPTSTFVPTPSATATTAAG